MQLESNGYFVRGSGLLAVGSYARSRPSGAEEGTLAMLVVHPQIESVVKSVSVWHVIRYVLLEPVMKTATLE